MTQKLLYLYQLFFKVVAVNIQKSKPKILDYSAFSKAKVTASYFDSHKTNFTEIDLIPVESKNNTPFYQSVRNNYKGITPTNNPISNDLKQINETKLYLYKVYNYPLKQILFISFYYLLV
jgi:hypothetical protein